MTDDDLNPLRWKVAELVTEIVEREGAFGMTIGTVEWEAGECAGDTAYPKRIFRPLNIEELTSTLDGVLQYIQGDGWTTEKQS